MAENLSIKQVRDAIEAAIQSEVAPLDVKDTVWEEDDCLLITLENGQEFTICVGHTEK